MNKYQKAINELKAVLYLPDRYLEKRLNILQELIEKYQELQDENARLNSMVIQSNLKEMGLIEKATPKKPVYTDSYLDVYGQLFITGECATCGGDINDSELYCSNCGQRISWGEEE